MTHNTASLRSPRLFPAVLAVMAGLFASPCAGRAETLEDALSLAYRSNPQLLAERAQLEATNENVPLALSNWRPTVTATVTGGKDRERTYGYCNVNAIPGQVTTPPACPYLSAGTKPPQTVDVGTHEVQTQKLYQSTYDITIDEALYRGGRTMAQTSQAYNLVNSERGHLGSVEQSVFTTVVTDYLSVIENTDLVALNLENESVLQKQTAATDDRYKLGELTHTDLYLAEAAYAQAIASRKAAEGQLQVARAAYQHDVGQPPGDLARPSAMPELPATKEEAASIAAAATPAVIQAQYAQQAAEDNIDVVRGALLPTVVAQAEYSRTADVTALGEEVTDKRLIAQGQFTVYDGGMTYAQSRAAQKTVVQRKQELDDARRAAVQAAQQSWAAMTAARASIEDLKHAVQVNEQALNGLQQEAQVGTRTVQDVLIQQQAVFQARVNLTQAEHDEQLDEFTLVAAIGRLNARNLALPVEYYDADKHLDAVSGKWFGFQTEP
jgi:outer membrane protein